MNIFSSSRQATLVDGCRIGENVPIVYLADQERRRRLWDTDDTSTMMRHVLTLVPYEDVRTLTGQVIEEWFSMVK